ncbi:MAG: hypothetical protein ABJH45_02270 [Paracoccaceae bacterium]
MKTISRRLLGAAIGVSFMAVPTYAQDAQTFLVTNTQDSGEGSLRSALTAASSSKGNVRVLITVRGDIEIASGLSYEGTEALDLTGMGNLIRTNANETLLSVPNGADLSINGLSFQGPGGFSVENRGDLNGSAGKGIAMSVPREATETIEVKLTNVSVLDVAGHGVHLSDCSLADECGGGSGGGGDGSAAGFDITLTNVSVTNVGHGSFDGDGFRADERGAGSITFSATGSEFIGVGADGVELDEGDAGDVIAVVDNTVFSSNGNYCDPTVMAAFLPDIPEGEFEDSVIAEDAIPGPVTGSPDDSCVEREVSLYDSGFVEEYEFGLDLDDGIDLDEAGEGSIISDMFNSVINDNRDEGVDWDEEGPGDIIATFVATQAYLNTDDGFKMSEEDSGRVIGFVDGALASANGGKGIVFEEEDEGDVNVIVNATATSKNDDSDNTGLEVVQNDEGGGSLVITASQLGDGGYSRGVIVE